MEHLIWPNTDLSMAQLWASAKPALIVLAILMAVDVLRLLVIRKLLPLLRR